MIICTSTIYHSTRIISNFNEALHPLDYPNDNKDHKKPSAMSDMYPLYWATSKEGIFMRYSYEFKLMCVELYHSGSYPDIPEGVIQILSKVIYENGPDWLIYMVQKL